MIKVVFHIDETAKWHLVLLNATNFFNEENEAEINILANYEAVKFYIEMFNEQNKDLFDAYSNLVSKKVKFYACGNALKANKIPKDSLDKTIMIVKSGVVELAYKQRNGYAYIKP